MIDHVKDFDAMNNHSSFANINDLNEYNRCKHTYKQFNIYSNPVSQYNALFV